MTDLDALHVYQVICVWCRNADWPSMETIHSEPDRVHPDLEQTVFYHPPIIRYVKIILHRTISSHKVVHKVERPDFGERKLIQDLYRVFASDN